MSPRIADFARALPVAALLLGSLVLGCSGNPFAPDPTPASRLAQNNPLAPAPAVAAEPFSVERAWAHLVALSDLGPRPPGSTANLEALEYIRTRLEELDLELIDIEYTDEPEEEGAEPKVLMRHLTARIPGESPDSIVLGAHYDTFDDSPGANDGASGPAVLLELARQLSERPLPYTVEIVFLDADHGYFDDEPDVPLLEGSRMMSNYLRESGTLEVVRLAVLYGQVGDADLTIGRDLHSARVHREVFFDTAAALGYAGSFPRGRGYVESAVAHRALIAVGMPRVVLIHDPWYGGDEMPGEYYGGENDVREHCAPQSLHTVGVVSLASLRQIASRLAKIDHVSGRAERRKAESLKSAELSEEVVEEVAEPAAESEEGAAEGAAEAMEMEPEAAPEPAPEVQSDDDTPAAAPEAAAESS